MTDTFNPPYWYHKNIKFPEDEINEVISELKKTNFNLLNKLDKGVISSYHVHSYIRPDNIWKKNYKEIVKGIIKNIGIYHTCKYTYEFWSQFYNKIAIHRPHSHFSGGETSISFVHFLRPTNDKCFNFLDHNGNDFPVTKESKGDILCFPSYLWHRVINNSDEERFVVAGNIYINYQTDDYVSP